MFNTLTKRIRRIFKGDGVNYKLIPVKPAGAPTFCHAEGQMVNTEANQDAIERLVRESKDVITPAFEDTPESLAGLLSQSACDREFPRIAIHPIDYETKMKVLEILRTDRKNFPMYEYREAGIVGDDDLNSKTIIYKYSGKTHHEKIL